MVRSEERSIALEEEEEDEEEEEEEVNENERESTAMPMPNLPRGACRADERSSSMLFRLPLLPLTIALPSPSTSPSTSPSHMDFDLGLLSHLTQLLDASEAALLLRCLCAPLVSLRVGIVHHLGSLLCPIPSRGQLNLSMTPSSWLDVSFVGDDGRIEQLCSISCDSSEVGGVIVEEIAADTSGRTFLVKVRESQVFYYWLSEKSLSRGLHLLNKMKDLLRKRPSLSDLTGISSQRLDSLGSHMQACLISPSLAVVQSIHSKTTLSVSASTSSTATLSEDTNSPHPRYHWTSTSAPSVSSPSSLSSREGKVFKNNASLSSSRIVIQNNSLKVHPVGALAIPSMPFNSPSALQSPPSSGAVAGLSAGLPTDFSPFNPLTFQFPLPPSDHASFMDKQPLIKPQYCWCPMGPPCVSSSLPPLPPFAVPPPVVGPSLLSLGTTVTSECTKVLHDPVVHLPLPLPLPVSSLVIPPLPSCSQFPAFTGLMSDPIVHVPVTDICSAGQAYLVSAGPSISTANPPRVAKPLVQATELVVEKNARETLMQLLESAPLPSGIHAVAFGVDAFSSVMSSAELGPCLEEDVLSEEVENEQELQLEGGVDRVG